MIGYYDFLKFYSEVVVCFIPPDQAAALGIPEEKSKDQEESVMLWATLNPQEAEKCVNAAKKSFYAYLVDKRTERDILYELDDHKRLVKKLNYQVSKIDW